MITFSVEKDGDLVVFDEVVLEDQLDVYGLREVVGGAIIVAAGTALDHDGNGNYSLDPVLDVTLTYEYVVKFTQSGIASYLEKHIDGTGTGLPITVGRYTNSSKIYNRFGQENVDKWASVNDANPVAVQLVIAAAIVDAEDFIDSALLHGLYEVPFTGAIPSIICSIATALAAVRIYESKGVIDWNVEIGVPQHRLHYQRKEALRHLDLIRQGTIALGNETVVQHMEVE